MRNIIQEKVFCKLFQYSYSGIFIKLLQDDLMISPPARTSVSVSGGGGRYELAAGDEGAERTSWRRRERRRRVERRRV